MISIRKMWRRCLKVIRRTLALFTMNSFRIENSQSFTIRKSSKMNVYRLLAKKPEEKPMLPNQTSPFIRSASMCSKLERQPLRESICSTKELPEQKALQKVTKVAQTQFGMVLMRRKLQRRSKFQRPRREKIRQEQRNVLPITFVHFKTIAMNVRLLLAFSQQLRQQIMVEFRIIFTGNCKAISLQYWKTSQAQTFKAELLLQTSQNLTGVSGILLMQTLISFPNYSRSQMGTQQSVWKMIGYEESIEWSSFLETHTDWLYSVGGISIRTTLSRLGPLKDILDICQKQIQLVVFRAWKAVQFHKGSQIPFVYTDRIYQPLTDTIVIFPCGFSFRYRLKDKLQNLPISN